MCQSHLPPCKSVEHASHQPTSATCIAAEHDSVSSYHSTCTLKFGLRFLNGTCICFVVCKADKDCTCRRRALEKSDGDDDEADDLDDDQFDEEEGDNELDGHAASSGIGEASSMLDGVTNREEDAQREVQRQRNLEQALLIQMEMQKKLHEQLEVSLFSLCNQDCKDIARRYCTVMLAMRPSHFLSNQLQSDLLSCCMLI